MGVQKYNFSKMLQSEIITLSAVDTAQRLSDTYKLVTDLEIQNNSSENMAVGDFGCNRTAGSINGRLLFPTQSCVLKKADLNTTYVIGMNAGKVSLRYNDDPIEN